MKRHLIALLAGLALWVTPAPATEPVLAPADIRADLSHLLARLDALHPDATATMDREAVGRMADAIAADLSGPMTMRQAWRALARLNPLFGDGHMLVQFPDRMAHLARFVGDGGRLLPVDLWIDDQGCLRLRRPAAGLPAGTLVTAINGRPSSGLVAAILDRTHGDSLAFRRALASARFAFYHWLLFEGGAEYRLTIADGQGQRDFILAGTVTVPDAVNPDAPFATQFAQAILPGDIGYLRVGSFDGAYFDAFQTFTADAFAQFRRAGVRDVIIDLRDNPGGNDANWTKGLAPYVATKPYRTFSQAMIRVNADNADPGDIIGSVQTIQGRKYHQPAPDNPDRVKGTTYLLTGTPTYSSAMLLLTAAQDHGLALIAGVPTGGRSCTTGLVKRVDLPRTGLVAYVPVVQFIRPSGVGCADPVRPDLEITDDPFDADRAVRDLSQAIIRRR